MDSGNSPSKIWLIAGLVLLGFALFSGLAAVVGFSRIEAPKTGPATNIALTVPGTTSADLVARDYAISLQGEDVAGSIGDGSEEFEVPEVTWEITGPAPAMVTHNISIRVNDVARAGEFTITEPGTYEITATLPEGATNEYSYSIENDDLAELGAAFGQAAGGLIQMVLGGLCGGLFGLLGLVFLIIHFAQAGRAKRPEVPPGM